MARTVQTARRSRGAGGGRGGRAGGGGGGGRAGGGSGGSATVDGDLHDDDGEAGDSEQQLRFVGVFGASRDIVLS